MCTRQHRSTSATEHPLSVDSLLSSIAAPIVLFHESGEIHFANPAFHRLLITRDWIWVVDRRLRSRNRSIDKLGQNLRDLADGRIGNGTLVLQGKSRRESLLVGFGLVPGSRIVMCNFVDPFQTHSPKAAALKNLFGLTENESEVTAMIALGLDYREIAADRHVSVETIRSYAKSIFRKLDVRSRANVVSKVQAATLPLALLFTVPCGD